MKSYAFYSLSSLTSLICMISYSNWKTIFLIHEFDFEAIFRILCFQTV